MENIEKAVTILQNQTQVERRDIIIEVSTSRLDNYIYCNEEGSFNAIHCVTWWTPFIGYGLTGFAHWKNITLEYSYKIMNGKPRFISVDNIVSYFTGLNIAVSWNQIAKSINYIEKYNEKDTVVINIAGYYELGTSLNGFALGATKNDIWETVIFTLIS